MLPCFSSSEAAHGVALNKTHSILTSLMEFGIISVNIYNCFIINQKRLYLCTIFVVFWCLQLLCDL